MKVLLDIKDDNADFVLELLSNFSYVKAKQLTLSQARAIKELHEAVENMALVKAGKLKPRPVKELLDEL